MERADDSEPARRWPEVEAENLRLVVLADPGLGKSWLIRTETSRLCRQALAAVDRGEEAGELLIPVPVRCDQLVVGEGQSLTEVVAEYLVGQRLVPPRSRSGLQSRFNNGGIVLLLDALDELATAEQYGRLKELLRSWNTQVGDRMRCVLTSRIAGYRGSPLPGALEVELQAFTPEEVTAAVNAWRFPPAISARVLTWAKDPAVAGMTRVPLLLALLCSLAVEPPDGQELPTTRGELYERVLRWFLTRVHRAEERPDRPELLAEEVDALLEILAPVAFNFASLPAGWTDLMSADQLRTAIRLAGPAFTERNRSAADILQELSIDAGILVPAGDPSAGRRPSYLFLHRTIAEYLVARHLASLPEADWLDVINQHLWFDPDWAEVIPMLGGQLDASGACRLVDHLLDQADDPFHHALLTAVRVIAERPDPDELLPAGDLQAIAEVALGLIDHPVTRPGVAAMLAVVPRLPVPMVDGLLTRLDDPDWSVRRVAAAALARREDPAVTDGLLARLDAPDLDVREAVVEALADRGASAVTEGLLGHLEALDEGVREAAVRALGRRKDPAVTDGLLASLDDPRAGVREAAVQALADRGSLAVTNGLLARLDDSDLGVREAAVQAAGRGSLAVTNGLLARLDDSDLGVREAAVQALADREDFAVIDGLLSRVNVPDPEIRRAAVEALAGREDPAVIDALLALLDDPDLRVRTAAVRALAHREDPVVIDGLLALLDDGERPMRAAAVRALARRENHAVTGRPLTRLDNRDRDAQQDSEVIDRLLSPLYELDLSVRQAAAEALTDRDVAAFTNWLLARVDHLDPSVREATVRTLADRDDPAVTSALLARLDDPNLNVRQAAVEALASRENPTVTSGLLSRLKDPDIEGTHGGSRCTGRPEGPRSHRRVAGPPRRPRPGRGTTSSARTG